MIEAINSFFDIQNMTGLKLMFLTFAPILVFFIAIKISDKQFDKRIRELEQQKS